MTTSPKGKSTKGKSTTPEVKEGEKFTSKEEYFLALEKILLQGLRGPYVGYLAVLRSDWLEIGKALPDFASWLHQRGQFLVAPHGGDYHVRLKGG